MLPALVLGLLSLQANAPVSDPTVPPNATAMRSVEGRGFQVYVCRQPDVNTAASSATGPATRPATAQATGSATAEAPPPQWTLQGPEAKLFDPASGAQLGTHSTGPVWVWSDGSSVGGKALARTPAPNPADVPWVLLATQPVAGAPHGLLSPVTLIRRSDTHGGVAPPSGCNAAHLGETSRVPYRATYTFYTPPPAQ